MDGEAKIVDLLDVPCEWGNSVRIYVFGKDVKLIDLLKSANMVGAVGRVRTNPSDKSVRLELYKGKRMLSVYKKGKRIIADEFEWREQ